MGVASAMVTKAEFTPTRMIAFGLVALVLGSVVIAMLAQIIKATAK